MAAIDLLNFLLRGLSRCRRVIRRSVDTGVVDHFKKMRGSGDIPGEIYGAVKSSRIFNKEYYLERCCDSDVVGADALMHFMLVGYKQGLNPNHFFDTTWYLDQYKDVAKSGQNPLYHYVVHGAAEGRNPSSSFDTSWYLNQYTDVQKSGLNPLSHFLLHGIFEGRSPMQAVAPEATKPALQLFSLSDLCNPYEAEAVGPYRNGVLFSVVTPTYNTEPRWIRELYQTLCNQSFGGWEWLICDDGSYRASTLIELQKIARSDPRVVLEMSPRSGNISYATNRASARARGLYIALVDHDDLLSRDVFLNIKNSIDRATCRPDIIYTDECKVSLDGEIYDVFLKPEWSPVLLENTMYIGHLTCYRAEFLRELGGMRSEFDGTQDFDLALRAASKARAIVHVPYIGYLWRAVPGSTAYALLEKSYAIVRQQTAILSAISNRHPEATVSPGFSPGYWRTEYPLPLTPPLVSYVIPTAAGRRRIRNDDVDLLVHCIESLERSDFYPRVEYIVVHNGNLSALQDQFLASRSNVRLVEYRSKIFNLADKINLGVKHSAGDYVCLLNDDVEAVTERGGVSLIGFMEAHPEVGAVAPFCLFEDGRTQHDGVMMLEQGPSHAGIFQHRSAFGTDGFLHCRREMFAVTGAMMFVRRERYWQIGGFNSEFPLNYNDVDFCLRLRQAGFSAVVDPDIVVFHFESASKIGTFKCEKELFFRKWPDVEDPYFNPGFDQRSPYYVLSRRSHSQGIGDPVTFERWLDRRIGLRRTDVASRTSFSVCVSIRNQSVEFLREMLAAVEMQTWPHKEIVIVDDASTRPETLAWLDSLRARADIKLRRLSPDQGIGVAQRHFLDLSTGDFIVPIAADDFLTVDALSILAAAIDAHPAGRVFYSDAFEANAASEKFAPFFKPNFDPVAISNCCFTSHVMAIQSSLMHEVGAYDDVRAAWCHHWDTTLRAVDRKAIPIHVPELLYARRNTREPTASGEKPEAIASERFVLDRTLSNRRLTHVLDVVPNTIGDSSDKWSLAAKTTPGPMLRLAFDEIWDPETLNLDVTASTEGFDWIAILSGKSIDDGDTTLKALSAPILWEDSVGVVSGLLAEPGSGKVLWGGGVFTASGVFDPSFGEVISGGGYHGQLYCQRCTDVAAPIDVMVRRDRWTSALDWLSANRVQITPGNLMIVLGQIAAAEGWLISVTPHAILELDRKMHAILPIDREGLLVSRSDSIRSSRWYRAHLSTEIAYQPSLSTVKRALQ